jgi:hypothetical protein
LEKEFFWNEKLWQEVFDTTAVGGGWGQMVIS